MTEQTDAVARLFDEWATRGRAEGMEQGHLKTALPAIERINIDDGTKFLDLGCGNAWASRYAAAKGAEVAGIDASQNMVEKASRLLPSGDFRVGDFQALPFEADSFDVVWSMEAIYYAADPDQVLREIHRVSRPGAELHILIDYYQENQASHGWPDDVGISMALRSESEWLAALQGAGFVDCAASRLLAKDPNSEEWKRTDGTLYLRGRRA